MSDPHERTRLLMGAEAMERLRGACVLIAGAGGVGGYAAEMLARTGVGRLVIIDADRASLSNINRQLIADYNTVGRPKTELWRDRLMAINPSLRLTALQRYITPADTPALLETFRPDFVADAIDTVAPKCALVAAAIRRRVPLISSMGAGGRTDVTAVRYGRLSDTCGDGLARAVRQRMRRDGLDPRRIRVVWSAEPPRPGALVETNEPNKRTSPGTIATVPAIFGIYMASHIIRKLTEHRP